MTGERREETEEGGRHREGGDRDPDERAEIQRKREQSVGGGEYRTDTQRGGTETWRVLRPRERGTEAQKE